MQREIIEEDERPRSLHSLCKLIEERLEVDSVDRSFLRQHRDDLAMQIDPCVFRLLLNFKFICFLPQQMPHQLNSVADLAIFAA